MPKYIRYILYCISLVGLWNILAPPSLIWMDSHAAGAVFALPLIISMAELFATTVTFIEFNSKH